MNSNYAQTFRNKVERHTSDAKSTKRRRTRARIACINCRRKKIRCAVQTSEGTCTNCRLDGVICEICLSSSSIAKPDGQGTSDLLSVPYAGGSDAKTGNVGKEEEFSPSGLSVTSPRDVEIGVHCLNDQFGSFKPDDLRNYLVKCFLQFIYPTFPLITLFQVASIAAVSEGNLPSCGEFVLNAFLAASIRFGDRRTLRTCGIHSKERAFEFFYSNAKSLFPSQMAEKSYTAIQGLLLMGYCETISSQETFFWLGMAHTVAISLRLDKESVNFPQPERGLRKRLWWCLFSQLTLLELTTGSPPYIQMQHATISVLNDEDFECTIPRVLLEDVGKSVNLHNGIGSQFLNLLDFFRTQQWFSNANFNKRLNTASEFEAAPQRTHGMCNHMQSGNEDILAESVTAETRCRTFPSPEDDSENAVLLYNIEQKLFDSISASGEDMSKNEIFDFYQSQDYFGDSEPAKGAM